MEVTNTGKTTIDTNSFRGTATPDMSSQKVISSFTNTDYDSTWYHAITKDSTNIEWSMSKWSLAHGTTNDGSSKDAFITDSGEIRTSHTPLTVVDANISGSTVQLLATANNDGSTTIKNAIAYYGIGFGDNTPTATSGKMSWRLRINLHRCLTAATFPTFPRVKGGDSATTASNDPLLSTEAIAARKLKARKLRSLRNNLFLSCGKGWSLVTVTDSFSSLRNSLPFQ